VRQHCVGEDALKRSRARMPLVLLAWSRISMRERYIQCTARRDLRCRVLLFVLPHHSLPYPLLPNRRPLLQTMLIAGRRSRVGRRTGEPTMEVSRSARARLYLEQRSPDGAPALDRDPTPVATFLIASSHPGCAAGMLTTPAASCSSTRGRARPPRVHACTPASPLHSLPYPQSHPRAYPYPHLRRRRPAPARPYS
jgi:hypothetical protein